MTTQNLNTVRIMTVGDWMQIARLTNTIVHGHVRTVALQIQSECLRLISNYESEAFKTLERKHFVCEVGKPDSKKFIDDTDFAYAWKDYQSALSHLIFEGFELSSDGDYAVCGDFRVWFNRGEVWIYAYVTPPFNKQVVTIRDLIFEIDRYNRTAATKIELKFTEAFIKKITG